VADLLQGADLTFGNLETPITPGREIADLEMTFRSDPGMQEAIKDAGFNILSLANNHTPNFGERGLTDSFSYLESVGIKYVGAGKDDTEAGSPVIIDIKGISIAFLAYNDEDVVPPDYEAGNHPGTALMRFEKMFSAVMDAKKMADVVVVSMHSGTEYIQKPNDSQVEFAHGAIDAGADLVVGHHPHVVQTMEKYKGKYIFYSLGNFVFDQMWSRETREGLMIKVYLNTSGVDRIYLLPIVIENYSQPRLASVEEAEKIVKRLTTPVEGASVFTWNKVKQDFDKGNRAVIYNNDRANRVINIKTKVADLDNDGNLENYSLDEGRLSISESSKVVWASPGEWWIDNFEIADVDNNGIAEISLSLWKEGSFGSSKPFWVRENDTSVKNHFFVYRFEDNYMKPVWHSSNLSEPNCGFKIDDVDDDGKNDLVVIEGEYMDFPECKGKYVAVWGWNSWGFTNKWRSGEGNFSKLEIEKMGGENSINADLF
jgi:poly-gamma-glutamate synthesis protein (capsule biosynthesis protein)